jgi:carbon-monoxide dehydrogenase medium subunit
MHADAEYRSHLARLLTRRALAVAAGEAEASTAESTAAA